LLPALLGVGLMLVWAGHDGGYDPDTWYWGALAALGLLLAVLVGNAGRGVQRSGATSAALVAFAAYVAWSYASIAWAQSPGDALEGSNRALLYLLLFALFSVIPWSAAGAVVTLLAYTLGVGAVALEILVRMAAASHVEGLFISGRLATPTGYYNSTAALFTIAALLAVALSTRRRLPAPLRGLMLAIAAAGLQLAVIGQSRGWLFTLPLVAVVAVAAVSGRLRFALAASIPLIAALAALSPLLHVFRAYLHAHYSTHALTPAAVHAARVSLLWCAVAGLAGLTLALGESRVRLPVLSIRARRALGAVAAAAALAAVAAGATLATHGDPTGFVSRQWRGFTHPPTSPDPGSHFAGVGSQRYDFWRVAWHAALAHPLGGLGQDNFADYYLPRRRTDKEPRWTHSLELRLLGHTGFVGLALFLAFLTAALSGALRHGRRLTADARFVTGAALLASIVWIIHGSVDWFWEIPALSGPALGFLAMAGALNSAARQDDDPSAARRVSRRRRPALPAVPRATVRSLSVLAVGGCFLVLGIPYLAIREISAARALAARRPTGALRDLARAASLNPLSPDPGRIGGVIALEVGDYRAAKQRFSQAIAREPGGWLAWFGAGLADSALGDHAGAYHDFAMAASIDAGPPVIRAALARALSPQPLRPTQALSQLQSELAGEGL
jgi:hypothetical protein